MTASSAHVKWAQRKDKLFVTLEVVDAADVKVCIDDRALHVTGNGICKVGSDKTTFDTKLALNEAVDRSNSSFKVLGHSVQVLLAKANDGYWDRLTSTPMKNFRNWLSVDWSLWKDEDDDDGAKVDFGGYGDLSNMMNAGANSMESDDDDDTPAADLADLDVKPPVA